MPGLRKWLESGPGKLSAGVAVLVGWLLAWLGAETQLCAGVSFLHQVLKVAWLQYSLHALIGLSLLTGGAFLTVAYVFPIIARFLRKQPIYPHVPVALGQATHSVRLQMQRAINIARPQGNVRRDIGLWERLVSAAVAGQTHPDVLKAHCEQGNRTRPVIFCNFRGYAHGVRAVLNELPQLGLTSPFPRVYTLLKRSVFEWYNPFPLVSDAAGTPGRVTLKWWEDYKSDVAILKTDETITMYRLAAHPPLNSGLGEINDYRMYSPSAINLSEAVVTAERCASTVIWLPSVQAALAASRMAARETSIHLIGRPNGETGSELSRVLTLFQSNYHSGPGRTSDEAGVFLRYLPTKTGHESLLAYDDLFIVELSHSLAFGLAFIDDESLDINGMRILPPHQLSTELMGRDGEALLLSFKVAWGQAVPSFQECVGLARCL